MLAVFHGNYSHSGSLELNVLLDFDFSLLPSLGTILLVLQLGFSDSRETIQGSHCAVDVAFSSFCLLPS